MDSTYALLGKYMETNRAHYTSVFSVYFLFSTSLVVFFLLFFMYFFIIIKHFVEPELTYSVTNWVGFF